MAVVAQFADLGTGLGRWVSLSYGVGHETDNSLRTRNFC
jgi:hypothetical protein